ncbi:MAG TPA: hypothetical protein VGA89_02355 [Patescibacteria group bacterium]|jgi:hypothetical protein
MNKQKTKSTSKTKPSNINQESDRSWVRPPNIITQKTSLKVVKKGKKYPTKISYWVDKNGEAQLYTAEQLAVCNILTNINVLLNKSLTLAENLKTMDKDVTVGTLVQQDYAQFKALENTIYGYFIELMAAAEDITFGEFLNFISQGKEDNAFSKLGKSKLKKVMQKKSPDVTQFYSSDKLREK